MIILNMRSALIIETASATNLPDVGDCSNNLIINGSHEEACSLNSPTGPVGEFLVSHVRIEVFPVISKVYSNLITMSDCQTYGLGPVLNKLLGSHDIVISVTNSSYPLNLPCIGPVQSEVAKHDKSLDEELSQEEVEEG